MIGFVFMNHRHTATIALATILVALTGCTGYTERIDTARADATREVRDYKYLQYPNLYLDRIKDARAEWEIEELLTAATTENQERETGYWECVETLGSPAGTWQAETGDPNTPGRLIYWTIHIQATGAVYITETGAALIPTTPDVAPDWFAQEQPIPAAHNLTTVIEDRILYDTPLYAGGNSCAIDFDLLLYLTPYPAQLYRDTAGQLWLTIDGLPLTATPI